MRHESLFRLSFYLTLLLAVLCLGFAEAVFLPGSAWLTVPLVAALGAAFLLEGRWALGRASANVLAVLGLASAGLWIVRNLANPANSVLVILPMPAALVPYAGPILMVLQLPLLFRPKQARDHWTLYSVSLIEVVLSCVLAGDLLFGLLLFGYLATLAWSLTLFHVHCEMSQHTAPITVPYPAGVRRVGLGSAVRWAAAALALGFGLFVLTPRMSQNQWDNLSLAPGDAAQTGFARMIDLNHTGALMVDTRVAFKVYAQNRAGNPKTDLDADQHWRGATLDFYDRGRWMSRPQPRAQQAARARPIPALAEGTPPPDLGPGQYRLTFVLDAEGEAASGANGLFLADPVVVPVPGGPLPLQSLIEADGNEGITFSELDWTLVPPLGKTPDLLRYQQATRPADEHGTGPTVVPGGYLAILLVGPSPRVREFAIDLLRDLVARGQLSEDAAVMAPVRRRGSDPIIQIENREQVARALCQHLSASGAYTYTLVKRRTDLHVDPAEDFLCNVKQGHCEQYAAGLVLLLRALGMPCRIVNGYRGVESQEEDGAEGWYVVRQSHAHSWVEVLLEKPVPGADPNYYWLTLDPSPAPETIRGSRFDLSRLWQRARDVSRELWWSWVIDYNTDQRHEAVAALWRRLNDAAPGRPEREQGAPARAPEPSWGSPWPWLGAMAPLWLVIWWLQRRRRQRSTVPATEETASDAAFYRRWLAVVARRCRLAPRPSQTPLEFGTIVAQHLRRLPGAAHLAEVPADLVAEYYRVRFGGYTLAPAECANLARAVDGVDTILAHQLGPR
jgi:hypothetical protein